MNLKILEEKKNKLVFELEGESHTFCGILKKELWNDEHVKAAGYYIEHPLLNVPRFVLETDGADPKKTLQSAAKRIEKDLTKVKEVGPKELR